MSEIKYDNPMRRNVYDLPGLCVSQVEMIEKASRMVFRDEEVFAIRRILITGCGDSYAAGFAAKYVFEGLADIPVEVIGSMDLARFSSSDLMFHQKESTLVIAVSNSGKVVRVAEALERAGKNGCQTLAITGNPSSPLAQAAKKVVNLSIPPFEAANGVRSFLVSVLSLIIVAIRFGEIKCRYPMTQAEQYRKDICSYAESIRKAIPSIDTQMLTIAEKNTDKRMYDFIASGPSYATAWFAHAKIIEATGDFASFSGVEDWLHLNCFLREIPQIFSMIITQGDERENSRVEELAGAMIDMKRDLYVQVEDETLSLPKAAVRIIMPKPAYVWMSPLFNQIPISLLAGYMAVLRGESYGRGCKDNWAICGTTDLLTKSRKYIY